MRPTNDESGLLKETRDNMVKSQLEARNIVDENVLRAMKIVPRHKFVPKELQEVSYADCPLPIGSDQTISQPYIVAYMSEALAVNKGDKVLEVGCGSGYQAAVLAEMGITVYTIEIISELERQAELRFAQMNDQVHVRLCDGYSGWPEAAPFDGIIVTAAPEIIPPPLIHQLKDGGRLVIPIGRYEQILKVLRKKGDKLNVVKNLPVRFVPMTGQIQQT